ncbi:unnamed protein product [Linum tenue]|uniref:Uncharacterized protein n=1 Tax=Linum tenue TaxID=586396 RepID=A0AAV0NAP2_9ROSI|nr:unnamed protein product [Linum tenue]
MTPMCSSCTPDNSCHRPYLTHALLQLSINKIILANSSYIQMKAIASAVMMDFQVLPVDGGASPERMMNPPYVLSLLLRMRGGLPVMIKRRG